MSKLKLREIIWEMTTECHNDCTYCGSQKLRCRKVPEEHIRGIADSIVEYPPEEVDVSGGDPLIVSYETHTYVTKLFKNQNIKCKILVNPLSLTEANLSILRMYDWIGLSINTLDELQAYKKFSSFLRGKITFITNFNLQNFYLVDTFVDEFTKDGYPMWQVQYTMFREYSDNNLAIHEGAADLLNALLNKNSGRVNIIIADNANSGECDAGISSLGLLADGSVVPCLSMRAWMDKKELDELIQGNILHDGLKNIWMSKFEKHRFCEKAPSCKRLGFKPLQVTRPEFRVTVYGVVDPNVFPQPDNTPQVIVYAVSTPLLKNNNSTANTEFTDGDFLIFKAEDLVDDEKNVNGND